MQQHPIKRHYALLLQVTSEGIVSLKQRYKEAIILILTFMQFLLLKIWSRLRNILQELTNKQNQGNTFVGNPII